jgi:hypothetical protein
MAKQNVFAVEVSNPVSIMVLPKSLVTLTAAPLGQNAKLGGEAKFKLRVQRRYNYDGELKVKLTLPPGTAGLEAAETIIPAGKDEADLVLKIAPNAAPGNRANLSVKAVAMFAGKPIEHEVKISVNVTK